VKASEFPELMRNLEIPGASVKPAEGKPGSGMERGFLVIGNHGARIAWQVATQNNGLLASGGPPAIFPVAVPAEPNRLVLADVEASIGTWIGGSVAAPHVRVVNRYSESTRYRIKYGLSMDLYSGGRVFIQALWILEPGEEPGRDNKYRMRDAV
jgi:hypothetical protein